MAFWWESSNQWVKNQRWWTLTLPQLTPLWAGVLISISTELDPQTWLHNTAIIHCCSEQWHVEFPGHRDSSSQPSVRTRALLKSLWSHRWVQQLFSIKCGKGKQLLQYSMMAMTKGDKGNYLAAGNKQEGQILPNRLIFFQQAWFQKGSENKSSENRFKLETRYQNEHKLKALLKSITRTGSWGYGGGSRGQASLGFTDTAVHPNMRSGMSSSSPHWPLIAMTNGHSARYCFTLSPLLLVQTFQYFR